MTPIESVLTELGITYRVIDDEAFAACPFHSPDMHPSWSCNIKSGVHYCFSCGARGSLSSLVSYMRGTTYSEATIYVNQQVGSSRIYAWREDFDEVSFSPMALKVTQSDLALFTDPPQEALDSKNITPESARLYNIRWNPEHKTWIFPFYDPYSNELWGWQEKNARIFRNYPAGTKKSRTLFGISNLADDSTAVVVESPIDCAVLSSAGVSCGVSTFGVPGGSHQLTLVQRRCNRIVLAFDNDTAGSRANREFAPVAAQLFDDVKIYNYGSSKAKDPGEQTYEEIRWSIDNALDYLDYYAKS